MLVLTNGMMNRYVKEMLHKPSRQVPASSLRSETTCVHVMVLWDCHTPNVEAFVSELDLYYFHNLFIPRSDLT